MWVEAFSKLEFFAALSNLEDICYTIRSVSTC